MSQLSLFENPQLARHRDPITSHDAAVEVAAQLPLLQHRFVMVVAELGPLTAAEVGQACASRWGGMAESYRKRAIELVRARQVEIGGVRVCRVSGKKATTYRRPAV